jgi:hypothetical protein
VQGRHPHRRAADEHRIENRERGRATGAPDRHLDVAQHGRSFLGRELERDRPPRGARREAEEFALRQLVDLGHYSVDLVAEVVAVLLPVAGEPVHARQVVDDADFRVDRKAELGEELQRLVMAGELGPADDLTELVRPEAQLTTGGDPRVLLAQAAGTRVPRIGEHRLTGLRGTLVERFEALDRHVHLAAHLDDLGRSAGQLLGQCTDGGDVRSDIFADATVTTRRRLHELAAFVAKAHRQPVDLQLAHETRRGAAQPARHTIAPRSQLGLVHRIVEARHRHAVHDRREGCRKRCTTDVRCRRIGRRQLGVLGLELQQFAHQQVVVGVGDLRAVERVIPLVVIGDQTAELFNTRSNVAGFAHACECKQLGT